MKPDKSDWGCRSVVTLLVILVHLNSCDCRERDQKQREANQRLLEQVSELQKKAGVEK